MKKAHYNEPSSLIMSCEVALVQTKAKFETILHNSVYYILNGNHKKLYINVSMLLYQVYPI